MLACLSPNGLRNYRGTVPCARLLVGTLNGLQVLQRSGPGDSWRLAGSKLDGLHLSSLLFEPRRGGLFAGVHGSGLYFSPDQGETWEPRMSGLTVEHVFTLASAEVDGNVILYAGTEPANFFRSQDYGQSWELLPGFRDVPGTDKWEFPAPPHQGHLKTLAFDARQPGRIYAGVEQGALLRSEDGGVSWVELESYSRPDDPVYKDVHQVLLRPSNQDEIFMTGGMGLYHSTDRGATWEHVTGRDFRIGYPDQLLFSPVDDRVMFMSGASNNPGSWRTSHQADSTVLRSADGGRTWVEANRGLPADMRANIEAMTLYSTPEGFSIFAANTDGQIFVIEDGAESWSCIAQGLPPVSKVGHYRNLQAAAA